MMQLSEFFKTDEQKTRWCLFLGITAWFLALNTFNALTSLACKWGWFAFTVAGIPGLVFMQLLVTLIALALLLAAIYVPARNWRHYQSAKPGANPQLLHDTEQDRRPLVAFIAMTLNSFLFLFAIAYLIPLLTLNACGQV